MPLRRGARQDAGEQPDTDAEPCGGERHHGAEDARECEKQPWRRRRRRRGRQEVKENHHAECGSAVVPPTPAVSRAARDPNDLEHHRESDHHGPVDGERWELRPVSMHALEGRVGPREPRLHFCPQLRYALFELRVEPREVELVQLPQVGSICRIDQVEPLHQLVGDIVAELVVELARQLRCDWHGRS